MRTLSPPGLIRPSVTRVMNGAFTQADMYGHFRLALAALVLALPLAAAPAPAATVPREIIVARTPVPEGLPRVGEVLLIRRGDADVVETRIETTLIRRVVAEIGAKERRNWPADTPDGAASARYVAALDEVAADLAARRSAARGARRVRAPVRLLIEFLLADGAARVTIGSFEPAAQDIRVLPLAVLDLPPAYVRRNMRLIVADAFHLEGAALDRALAPLARLAGPADSPAGRASVR